MAYIALRQNPSPEAYISFVVKAKEGTTGLAQSVGAAIMETDRRLSLTTSTLEEQVDDSLRLRRTLGWISGFFGSLALVLASIGLYGIMSYIVARRRTEIGVRMALGADRRRIVAMVLMDVGRIVTLGITVGISAALATFRLADAALYGVSARDPMTLLLSSLVLGAVGVAAATVPAWRASHVDLAGTLRSD
jgi:ABC-type antimicrobial peptide transport system permease subunit